MRKLNRLEGTGKDKETLPTTRATTAEKDRPTKEKYLLPTDKETLMI
jgi:hypothetical protein